jgi:hypothetical protein
MVSFCQEPFYSVPQKRAWEVIKHLSGISVDIKPSDMVDHENQFGIFLSDIEKSHQTWNLHLDNAGFHFKKKFFILCQNDLSRLKPQISLNDEVLNGYITLLNEVAPANTIFLYSRFWPLVAIESHKEDDIRLKRIALEQV